MLLVNTSATWLAVYCQTESSLNNHASDWNALHESPLKQAHHAKTQGSQLTADIQLTFSRYHNAGKRSLKVMENNF